MPSGVEASWWILLFVYKCLQRSVLGRGGSSTNQQSLTALHSPKCVCEPFGRSCVFIGCAGSQPIMFIAALGWRRVLLNALVPTVMTSLIKRALFEIFGQSTNHRRRCNKRCVFCEGDRREAELCLYTGWIVLETRIPMVVFLCYYCLSFWRFGFEFGMSIVDVAGANPDCRGRFSWVHWQKIGITPWNYDQSIEHNESFPKRHSLPSYDHYKPRYWGLGE